VGKILMRITKYTKREDGLIEVEVSDENGNVVGTNHYGPESYPVPRDPSEPTLFDRIRNLFGGE
jgi:hypothetical protein